MSKQIIELGLRPCVLRTTPPDAMPLGGMQGKVVRCLASISARSQILLRGLCRGSAPWLWGGEAARASHPCGLLGASVGAQKGKELAVVVDRTRDTATHPAL